MEFDLIELTTKNDIIQTYEIYKACIFMPTAEKFNKKVDKFLSDNSIKIFACLHGNEVKGVIVVSFTEQYNIEIIGIAVNVTARHLGIGSYMINKLIDDYSLVSVYAETDNDAVEFYRKNGFKITEFSNTFDGETVIRYNCELSK